MEGTERLSELREYGRMRWIDSAQAWSAEPDEVVRALTASGFEECKREVARTPRGPVAGGVWQGVHPHTGAVACTVWSHDPPLVFIHIDGRPVKGSD